MQAKKIELEKISKEPSEIVVITNFRFIVLFYYIIFCFTVKTCGGRRGRLSTILKLTLFAREFVSQSAAQNRRR